MINRKQIAKIKRKISRDFPEFQGIKPTITEKEIKPQDKIYKKLSLTVPKQFRRIYKLKFRRTVETVDKVKMERILVVTLDEQGKIVKITQSK